MTIPDKDVLKGIHPASQNHMFLTRHDNAQIEDAHVSYPDAGHDGINVADKQC